MIANQISEWREHWVRASGVTHAQLDAEAERNYRQGYGIGRHQSYRLLGLVGKSAEQAGGDTRTCLQLNLPWQPEFDAQFPFQPPSEQSKPGTAIMDFFQFTIQRLVLHKVQPRQNRAPVAPVYGQSLVNMGVDGLKTLQNRIVKAMGNDSRGVEMAIDQHGAGSFFATATGLLESDDNSFVESSKLIANRLNDAQATRDLPGGALVVMTGVTGANAARFLAVIKAEMQDGFDLEESEHGLTVQYLNNLMLTPAQRFYKIGLLLERTYNEAGEGGRVPGDFSAILYDQQMSAQETHSAAQYFYRSFLGSPSGCKTASPPSRKQSRSTN